MIERVRFETVTAFRSLAATPVPTLAAVATLAVAAGVNLAMFGLINRALLSPPAHVAGADRVFTVGFQVSDIASEGRMTTTSPVTYAAIRGQVPALSGAAAFQRQPTSAVVEGEQRRVSAMLVSGSYFDVLGARPWLGAGIGRPDDDAGAPPAAVLSHAFWRAAFSGDRDVIGRRLFIRGLDYTVAGVMPEGFSGHSATGVDLWVPFAAAMRNSPGWDRDAYRNILSIVVRLAPGETRESAEAQATGAVNRRVTLAAIVGAEVAATEQRVAWWLGGVSLLVLVIGLANAGTLLVVRAAKLRQHVAIRAALGASRRRLVAQALAEAIALALAATALSLLIAPWLDDVVRRVLFPGVIAETGLRMTTLVAAFAAGGLAAVVAAVCNLWQLPTQAMSLDLVAAGRTGPRRGKAMTGLLLVQTMLSVLLLAGAGMFGTSFHRLASQDFGMRMDGVVLVEFEGPGVAGQGRLLEAALDQVRAMPHVQQATVIDAIPFGGFNVPPISVPGRAEPPNVGRQLPHLIAATPELLKILDIEIVEGRPFTASDDGGPLVVIVNRAMARGVWPGESAVGKCIRIGYDPDFDPATASGPPTPSAAVPCREVIGVSRDVRYRSLLPVDNEARLMQYFVPFSQVPSPFFDPSAGLPVRGLLLRTDTTADALAAPIRRLVVGERTDLPFLQRAAVRAIARSADAAVATGHDAARALQRARARRRRRRALCGVRPRGRGAPARDGDPNRDRRAAGRRPADGAARSARARRHRHRAGLAPGDRLRPVGAVPALRNDAVRSARAERGSGRHARRRGGRHAAAGADGSEGRSEHAPASTVRRMPPITRRRFGTLAGAMVAPLAFSDACHLPEQSGPTEGARIAARAKPGTKTTAQGTRALGLDAERDAILHVPAGAASAAVPLLVLLHGAGGTGERQMQRLRAAIDAAGIAVLAPDSRGSTWDAIRGGFGRDVIFLNRALERVFETVAIDPDRVGVGGFSDGATYAISLGLINGDLFRRILAFSPGFVVAGERQGRPRCFVSHGKADEILPIDRCSRVIVPALRQLGYDVTFREFDGGHEVPAAVATEGMQLLTA